MPNRKSLSDIKVNNIETCDDLAVMMYIDFLVK